MKISYNWLREFVDIAVDAPMLGQKITHVGLAFSPVPARGVMQ